MLVKQHDLPNKQMRQSNETDLHYASHENQLPYSRITPHVSAFPFKQARRQKANFKLSLQSLSNITR